MGTNILDVSISSHLPPLGGVGASDMIDIDAVMKIISWSLTDVF